MIALAIVSFAAAVAEIAMAELNFWSDRRRAYLPNRIAGWACRVIGFGAFVVGCAALVLS